MAKFPWSREVDGGRERWGEASTRPGMWTGEVTGAGDMEGAGPAWWDLWTWPVWPAGPVLPVGTGKLLAKGTMAGGGAFTFIIGT